MPKVNNLVKTTQALSEELLRLLGLKAEVVVNLEGEGENTIVKVDIETEDSGLLIGAHGSTLNAIQSFLALSLRQQTGQWQTVSVDIGQWRARHEDYLRDLAKQASDRAKATGEPQHLYNLTPAQRRIIHVHLSEENGIETESQGEGEGRYLVVRSK